MRYPAPRLRQKLDPLRTEHVKDGLIAALLENQRNPKVRLGAAALSRAQADEFFPAEYMRAFLRLYGLRPPEMLDARNPQHRKWFDLIAEPDIDAFFARVRILGGEVPAAPAAGSLWRQFLETHRGRADALGRDHILVNRLDRPLASPAFSMRAVPQGSWAAGLSRRDTGLVLNAGERISWMLTVGDLVKPQPSGEMHLFAFYDISVDGNRMYVPLLPAPEVDGVRMPESCMTDPFVEFPQDPSHHNCLVVDSGWDERALTVLVSASPLEEDILEDTRLDGPIVPERLDLLAARLCDVRCRPTSSWALMRLNYRVNQGGLGIAA